MRISKIPLNCALALVLSFSLLNAKIHAEEQGEIATAAKIGAIGVLPNDAKAFVNYTGPFVLEAFAAIYPDLIGITGLWYSSKYEPTELVARGLELLKANSAGAGLV